MGIRLLKKKAKYILKEKNGIKIPKDLERVLSTKIGTDYLYDHPDVYDLAYKGSTGDVNFYKQNTSKGKVLYLGIGSGRGYLKLIKNNSNIYGLDYSKTMVESLKKKNPKIDATKIIFANVLNAKIEKGSFDKIIAPFSFFTQFEIDDVEKIFANCNKWLKKDGILITDFFSPYHHPTYAKKSLVKAFTRKGINKVKVTSYEFYDFIKQKLYEFTLVETKGKQFIAQLDLNFYFPNEIIATAKLAGFKLLNMWGDFQKKELNTNAETMVFVFKKI